MIHWLVINVVIVNNYAQVYNPNNLTWEEARSNCNLFGQNVQGPLTDLRITSTESSDSKAWIGAFQGLTPWLSVKGCYNVFTSDLPLVNSSSVNNEQVGSCVLNCAGRNLYGLTVDQCFCLTTMPTQLSRCEPTLCRGSTTDFCGGPIITGVNATTSVMFYEIYNEQPALPRQNGHCLLCRMLRQGEEDELRTTYQYEQGSCSSIITHYACRIDDVTPSYILRRNYNRINWATAVQECSRVTNSIAETCYFNTVLDTSTNVLFWVGLFRREFVSTAEKIPLNANVITLCAAVEVQQDGSLVASYEDCRSRFPSWCELNPTTEYKTVRPLVISPIRPPRGTSIAGVLIPVGLIIIAVVIIVTTVCLRKRILAELRRTWLQAKSSPRSKVELLYTEPTGLEVGKRRSNIMDTRIVKPKNNNSKSPVHQNGIENQNKTSNSTPTNEKCKIKKPVRHSLLKDDKKNNTCISENNGPSATNDISRPQLNMENKTEESKYDSISVGGDLNQEDTYDHTDYKQTLPRNVGVTGTSEGDINVHEDEYDHLVRVQAKHNTTDSLYDHCHK